MSFTIFFFSSSNMFVYKHTRTHDICLKWMWLCKLEYSHAYVMLPIQSNWDQLYDRPIAIRGNNTLHMSKCWLNLFYCLLLLWFNMFGLISTLFWYFCCCHCSYFCWPGIKYKCLVFFHRKWIAIPRKALNTSEKFHLSLTDKKSSLIYRKRIKIHPSTTEP